MCKVPLAVTKIRLRREPLCSHRGENNFGKSMLVYSMNFPADANVFLLNLLSPAPTLSGRCANGSASKLAANVHTSAANVVLPLHKLAC